MPERAEHHLLIVAVRTDDRFAQRRIETILAATASYDERDTAAAISAKPVDDLTAEDLDRLAAMVGGWDAVRALNLGVDVVGGHGA